MRTLRVCGDWDEASHLCAEPSRACPSAMVDRPCPGSGHGHGAFVSTLGRPATVTLRRSRVHSSCHAQCVRMGREVPTVAGTVPGPWTTKAVVSVGTVPRRRRRCVCLTRRADAHGPSVVGYPLPTDLASGGYDGCRWVARPCGLCGLCGPYSSSCPRWSPLSHLAGLLNHLDR